MVRRAEGTPTAADRLEVLPRNGVYEQRLGLFDLVERREYGGHTLGHHRLSRTGRPHHEQAMPSRRGNYKRALGHLLVNDIGKVRAGAFGQGRASTSWACPRPHGQLGHTRAQLGNVLDDPCLPRTRGQRPQRPHQREALFFGKHVVGNETAHPAHLARKRELAYEHARIEPLGWYLTRAREDGNGNGQIEPRTRLSYLARGQVDREVRERKLKPARPKGTADPVTCLHDRRVGHAHDGYARDTLRNADLHYHGLHFYALEHTRARGIRIARHR